MSEIVQDKGSFQEVVVLCFRFVLKVGVLLLIQGAALRGSFHASGHSCASAVM